MTSQPPPPSQLQLAHLLSDLVSLRVCDPAAALALVSARPDTTDKAAAEKTEEQDSDIKRAKELVELHYAVKEAHRRGELESGLEEARASVDRAVGI